MIVKRNPYTHVPGSCVNEPEPEVVDQLELQSIAYDDGWDDAVDKLIAFVVERADIYKQMGRREAHKTLMDTAQSIREQAVE